MGLVSSYRAAFRGLPRELWILAGATLINRSGMMVLPFLAIYLTREVGTSAAGAGLVLAVYGAGAFAGNLAGGRLADRFHPKPVQVASLATNGVLLFLLGSVRSVPAIVAVVALAGLCGEAFRPANMASVAAHAPEGARTRAFALQRLAINAGMTIGPALGGFLARIDFAWLFRIDGGTCIAASVFLGLVLPGAAPAPDAPDAAPAPTQGPLRDRLFVLVLLLLLPQGLVFVQLMSTMPIYLRGERGFTEDTIGLLISVNTVVILLTEMQLSRVVERWNPFRVLGAASLFIGLGFGLLPWAPGVPLVALTVVVWTFGEMMMGPVASAWVAGRAPPTNRGGYMAWFTVSFAFVNVVGPLIGTTVLETFGSTALWVGTFVVGALDTVAFWILAARLARVGSQST